MSQPNHLDGSSAHAERRPGVLVSARTWLPTVEQLRELEAAWAPVDAQSGPMRRAAASQLDDSHA